MNSRLIIRSILVLGLIIGIVAPFTFLKPTHNTDIGQVTTPSPDKQVDKLASIDKGVIEPVVEKPLHQVKLPNFSAIKDVKKKKQRFFDFIRPAIEKENTRLLAKRSLVESWLEKISLGLSLSDEDLVQLSALVKKYRVRKKTSVLQQVNELLQRIDIVPASLVLVQAANESAWGTSRFARIGLNFFGIWCYRAGCGMVPEGRNSGAKHEVAAFKSIDAAVARYFYNINSHNAYRVFRTIRFELRSQNEPLYPEILATGLLPYSERGAEYVIDLTKMLRHNRKYLPLDELEEEEMLAE